MVGDLQGVAWFYSSGFEVNSFARALLPFRRCLAALLLFAFLTMGSRGTTNSLQTAPVLLPVPSGEEASVSNVSSSAGQNVSPPSSQVSQASLPPAGPAIAGVSPEMVALITQTVQAVLAAERESSGTASTTSQPVLSAASAITTTPPCSGGVPAALPSLTDSASSLLAAGTGFGGHPVQGRPSQSFVVPSFVSTFSLPSMSSFAPSASNVCSSQSGAIRDFAARSVGPSASLLDQPFVVGPGFSPVPAKLVAQIVAGKYVDLSDLLAVNLLQKETEPQVLFDGRLVLTSQPKQQRRKIEDIASWMEAFSIFAMILVTHFPHRWKDLLQYQLLILRTFRHFSGKVWLAYDRAFREHAAAIRLTDWSSMNVQLFNFHAAGSSVRDSTLAQSNEYPEPPGSSSSNVVCISWNKGRCTAPFASCRYAHRCNLCSGSHRATTCPNRSSRDSREERKRRGSSPGSSSGAKARRT